jgi:hypothetical protein
LKPIRSLGAGFDFLLYQQSARALGETRRAPISRAMATDDLHHSVS